MPALIWAAVSGVLTWDMAAPTLIGVGIFVAFLILYVAILLTIRAVARKKSRKVLIDSGVKEYKDVSARDLDVIVTIFANGETLKVPYTITPKARESLRHIRSSTNAWSLLGLIAALVGGIVSVLLVPVLGP